MTSFVDGERLPRGVAVGATRVFWVAETGIRSAPLSGGPVRDVSPLTSIRDLEPLGDDLFVADYSALVIWKIPADGTPEILTRAKVDDLGVTADHVYWLQSSADKTIRRGERQGHIARVPVTGGEVEVVIDRLEVPRRLAVTGSAVYYSADESNSVYRWPLAGGAAEVLAAGLDSNIVADDSGAWFVTNNRLPRLMFAPEAGPARVVASAWNLGRNLAVDASGLYLANKHGRVSRLPPGGSELSTLATGLEADDRSAPALALTAEAVLTTDISAGQVLRIDKAARQTCESFDGPCPTPIGDPNAVAASPRANADLERLAVQVDGDVVASQTTYDRLIADAAAIEGLLPGVQVQYDEYFDGQTVYFEVSEPAALAIRDGRYAAWDCLNAFYGLEEAQVFFHELSDEWQAAVRLLRRAAADRAVRAAPWRTACRRECIQPGRTNDVRGARRTDLAIRGGRPAGGVPGELRPVRRVLPGEHHARRRGARRHLGPQ